LGLFYNNSTRDPHGPNNTLYKQDNEIFKSVDICSCARSALLTIMQKSVILPYPTNNASSVYTAVLICKFVKHSLQEVTQ